MRLAHHQTPAADMPHRAPEPLAPPTTVQSAPRLLRRADLLRDFLAVVDSARVQTQFEVLPLENAPVALERVESGDVRGAFVLVCD